MAATFSTLPLDGHLSPLNNPVGLTIPNEKSLLNSIPNTFLVNDLEFNDDRYPLFTRTLGHQRSSSSMDQTRSLKPSSLAQSPLVDTEDWSRGIRSDDIMDKKHAANDMKQQAYDQQTLRTESPVQLSTSSFRSMSNSRTPTMPSQKDFTENKERNSINDVSEPPQDDSATIINIDSTTFSSATAKVDKSLRQQERGDFWAPETVRNDALVQDQVVQDTLSPLNNSTLKHPSASAVARDSFNRSSSKFDNLPTSPLASPSYRPSAVPIQMSAVQRVSVQQPTYVTPIAPATPVNPIYSPGPPLVQEEVCIECAMRDQDMADVDVTSPGVWERESDVYYRELLQREKDEEAEKLVNPNYVLNMDPKRTLAKGGRLTEQNIKIWLSLNPKEPQSRRQAIEVYVRTQVALLEAEALARARALQESRAIDNMMRSTYDHLRRSTLDSSAQLGEEAGGLRIRTSRSTSGQFDVLDARRSYLQSREVTLLENGMIVEHVDVRKEEKEERERRKKDERRERSRARKSSRSSVVDMMSLYSAQTPLNPQENDLQPSRTNGEGRPVSRFSQLSSRPLSPSSVLQPISPPPLRPGNGRLLSQVSLADTQSISSASLNKRSRFFAFRNWSEAWRSRESFAPSGMSGSMLDMHVALDNEAQFRLPPLTSTVDNIIPADKPAEQWPLRSVSNERGGSLDRGKKKKGLAKIWRMFSGTKLSQRQTDLHQYTNGNGTTVFEKQEDELPLTPPPPISYLVDRKITDRAISSRSPSTTPSMSPNGASVSSPPSSSLSTPPVHQGWSDYDHGGRSKHNFNDVRCATCTLPEEELQQGKRFCTLEPPRSLTPMLSEPDIRQRLQQTQTVKNASSRPPSIISSTPRPYSTLSLDKTLPPLPHETQARSLSNQIDQRPQTMYAVGVPLDEKPNANSHSLIAPPNGFREYDIRRKSFGGLTSRPDLSFLTLPFGKEQNSKRASNFQPDEFGMSRQSLGVCAQSYPFPTQSELPLPSDASQSPSKRKSRFGLGTLLGKITHNEKPPSDTPSVDFKTSSPSSQYDSTPSYGIVPMPRNTRAVSRMSIASRKAVEELVDQDPNFVAYRYPSADHTIDIVR